MESVYINRLKLVRGINGMNKNENSKEKLDLRDFEKDLRLFC